MRVPVFRIGNGSATWVYRPDKPSREELKVFRRTHVQVWRATIPEDEIVGPNGKRSWSFREVLERAARKLEPGSWKLLA